MLRRVFKFLLICLWAMYSAGAWACAICAPSAAEQTLTQRLYKSDAIAIGAALATEGQYRILASVRGVQNGTQIFGVSVADGGAAPDAGTSVLLAQSGGTWRVMAFMPVDRAAWVQKLIALRRPADADPAQANWAERFAFFAPDLESPVAAVAQVAYEELSIAPFGAMRAASRSYATMPFWQWLSQPRLADRHPLYALLHGFVAPRDQASALEQRLLGASARESLASASALMAAVVEMQGDKGMAWLTKHYLQDGTRSDTEVQAALLAVRVHAADGVRVSKSAATQALRAYIQSNPQRAGFAASDLGDWGQWNFIDDFERLLDTDTPQVFASRYAMVLYLLRNPQPQAKAALERLRAKGRL